MPPKQVLAELPAPAKVHVHKADAKTVITFEWFNANHTMAALSCGLFGIFAYLLSSSLANAENLFAWLFLCNL